MVIRKFTYTVRDYRPHWSNYLHRGEPLMRSPEVSQVAVFAETFWTHTTTFEDRSFAVQGCLCPWTKTFDGDDDGAIKIDIRRDHWGL